MKSRRFVAVFCASLAGGPGCGGETPSAPPTDTRVTESLDYVFVVQRTGYTISGPRFTTRAAGPVDVRATFSPVAGFTFGIDLMYLGGPTPHNEGNGGSTTTGTGPTLSGSWRVGFVGEFQARVSLASPQSLPFPVPVEGLRVPVTFSVTHP